MPNPRQMLDLFLIALVACFLIDPAHAQSQAGGCVPDAMKADNSLDQISNMYESCARQWEAKLGEYALRLFWLLAAIEFTWSAIRLVFRNADLNEWLGELVNQVFFIGIFLALLTNGTDWTTKIVQSFQEAAIGALQQNGVPAGVKPSDLFDTGVNIAGTVLSAFSFMSIVQSLASVIAAFFILVCFALIAAAIILAKVESFIVLSAGVLLMGFGGSRWTKDFALKTVIYAVSVGAKLFILQLIAGLGAQIVRGWSNQMGAPVINGTTGLPIIGESELTNVMIIVGSTLVLWVLVKTVPDMIQGLINGTALGANTGLAGAAASLVGAAYALNMAAQAAGDLAREQIAEKHPADPGKARPLLSAAHALGNLGGATVANIGNRLSGRAIHGNRIGQVASDLQNQAGKMQSTRERREDEAKKAATAASTAAASTPTSSPPSPTPGPATPSAGQAPPAGPPGPTAAPPSFTTGTPANQNTPPPSAPKKP